MSRRRFGLCALKLLIFSLLLFFDAVLMAGGIGDKSGNYGSIVQKIILGTDTLYNFQKTDSGSIVMNNHEEIEFDFYSSALSEKQRFKYILKGLDKQWSEWTYKNSANYYNLPPGNYIFCISSEDDYEEIPFIVKSAYNRYITSSVLLFFLVILSFFLLKYGILPSIKRKVNDWHKDSIAPLLNKYLTPGLKDELSEARKLSNKVTVKYEKATVLFADIQGFTKIVEHLNPETLIDELDRFFIYFDEVVGRLKIEKIKTIGDAYMCAGGLPKKNSTNPVEVVLAALEMQRYMLRSKNVAQRNAREFWELRIGIHTGPLISGVVGSKKLSFDIWGDTVNIASRMESSGVAGKINISGVTYELIKDFFVCEYRGKMPVKYKGETDMYFVKGIVPHLSINNEGILPNDDFQVKLQWIRYNDMEEMVLNQLRNELPSTLKYHSAKHTIDVCTQVEVLGRAEGLNSKELLLVKTAALFHDTGYMINPVKHEVQSVRFAREILPEFDYTKSEIEAISQLIMVTEKETQPKMLMEKIIKDADLDYLGRADFIPLSEKLWEEVCHFNGKMSQNEWNKKQYEFISQHVYYTQTAKALRQVNKEIQLKKIKEFLR